MFLGFALADTWLATHQGAAMMFYPEIKLKSLNGLTICKVFSTIKLSCISSE
jgi:hypothetical protein